MKLTRRKFHTGLAGAAVFGATGGALYTAEWKRPQHPDLHGRLGVVTASLSGHIAAAPAAGKITLFDLPQFLKNDLGLEIIDFNTANIPSFEPAYLGRLRAAVEKSGCTATNLKMNQAVDMNSADAETRALAMAAYKKTIDAAKEIGCRWVRPLPRAETPGRARHIGAFNELIDYAGERGITVLIENFGWMMKDPDSVVNLVNEIGRDRVGVGIDTGNWSDNAVRYPALEKTFPFAVTCDFKAKTLTDSMEHPAYDLERCFKIGWENGFRGPWAFEHSHKDFETLKRHLIWLREKLTAWQKAAQDSRPKP